jgi:hypothetical protein
VLRHDILSEGSNLFPVWITLGGIGAALVFAVTVVSAPLLLDRDVDMLSALVTSVRAVGENPIAMAFWATLIMIATWLSLATFMAGFVIAIPSSRRPRARLPRSRGRVGTATARLSGRAGCSDSPRSRSPSSG